MAKHSKQLLEIASRHQVYLEKLKSGVSKEFQKVPQKLEKAIVDVVSALRVETMDQLTRVKLNKLLDKLRNTQTEILASGMLNLTKELKNLAEYEAEFEARAIVSVAAPITAAKITTAAKTKAYKQALETPLSTDGQLLTPYLKDWTKKEVNAVNNLVRKAWSEGWTIQQTVQAFRGTKRNKYKDGLMARVGRDADSVIRTAMQHVSSSARVATWAQNSDLVKGYRWLSTLDGKTSTQCRTLDGQEFEIGKGPTPPIHIRCRSTTTPVLDERFAFLDEGATRSSKDGYVDANLTYYEWLKKQPVNFQDDVLGPTRGKLFRKGGLTSEKFSQLNLDRNFEPMSLDEMKTKEPKVFEKAGISS